MKFGDFERVLKRPRPSLHFTDAYTKSQNPFSICKKGLGLEISYPANNTFYYVTIFPQTNDDTEKCIFLPEGGNWCMLQQQTLKIHTQKKLSIWHVCLRSLTLTTSSSQPEISNFMQANVDLPNFLNSNFPSNTHHNATFRFFNARILLYVPYSLCQRILCYKWEVGMDLVCISMKYFFLSDFLPKTAASSVFHRIYSKSITL